MLEQISSYLQISFIFNDPATAKVSANISISFFIYTDADGGPAVFVLGSTLGGIFIGLLVLLLIFVLYLRQRRNRGFEPLIKADFTNRKYTEEA